MIKGQICLCLYCGVRIDCLGGVLLALPQDVALGGSFRVGGFLGDWWVVVLRCFGGGFQRR